MKRGRPTSTSSALIATALLAAVVLWPMSASAATGNWLSQASGSTATLESIDSADASRVWVAGLGGTILSTTDGGFHWNAQASGTGNNLYAVSFPDASNGWAAGYAGTVRTTSDGGAHWSAQTIGPTTSYTGLSFPDASHGWVSGVTTLRATSDGGAHWSAQSPGASLWALDFADELNGWGVGAGGTIVHTADGGANWAAQSSGTASFLWSASFVDASHGWVTGANGTILVTADGGTTWTPQSSGTLSALRSVSFADALHGCAVGDGGTVLLTDDGGATWTLQPSGVTSILNGVTMPDATHVWAVGDAGVVLAYTLGPTTTLEATPAPNAAGWNATDVTCSLTATEGPQGGGPAETYFAVDTGALRSDTHTFTISDEGSHAVEYFSVDASGNAEATRSATVRIDKSAPVVTGVPTNAPNTAGWYRGAVTAHFSASDAYSGVANVSADAVLASEGASQSAAGSARDLAGNVGTGTVDGINIDLTPPTTHDDHVAAYDTSATISLTTSDALSGVASTVWSLDGVDGSGTSVEATHAGPHVLTYYSTDAAGNPEGLHTVVFTVLDVTAPTTTISPLPTEWVNHSVTFSLDATDDAGGLGVADTYYSLGASPAETYSVPVEIAREGTVTIGYASVDRAGNREATATPQVRVDFTPPALVGSATAEPDATGWYRAPVTVHFSATDALSGVETVSPDVLLDVDGAGLEATGSARDVAGNEATLAVGTINIDRVAPTTTDDHGAAYAGAATISLTATDALSGVALTSWTLDGVDGTGTVVSAGAIGAHTLEYASTDLAGNREDTQTATFTVSAGPPAPPAATSVTRPVVSPRTPRHGRRATFSAMLNPEAAVAGGTARLYLYRWERATVRRKVGGAWKRVSVRIWRLRVTRTVTADSAGRLSARVVVPRAGKWRARVRFAGSSGYAASSSAYAGFSAR